MSRYMQRLLGAAINIPLFAFLPLMLTQSRILLMGNLIKTPFMLC